MTHPDLTIIVPTKGRAHLIPRLYDSIVENTILPADITLVVCQDEFFVYMDMLHEIHQHRDLEIRIFQVDDDATYPSKLNEAAAREALDHRYMALFNDEHEVQTAGWDIAFKNALRTDPFGVAYGPDGVWENGEIPSAPMITASMYRALGWVALPGLWHILVDNVWKELALATGTLHFLPDVRIQHHHRQLTGKTDATYTETNDIQWRQDADSARYFDWLHSGGYTADVAKLRQLW